MEQGATPGPSSSAAPSIMVGFKEELVCPACSGLFREAVILPCNHSFCKGCVTISNQRHVCPVCKEESSLEDLRVNHTFRKLVELYLREEAQWQSRGATLCPLHQEEPRLPQSRSAPICQLHQEEPGFFCLEDKELVCFSCQNSGPHKGHRMKPVPEVAADFRAKLVNMESSLRGKAEEFRSVQRSYASIFRHNETHQIRTQRIACTVEEPEAVPSGMLLDVIKHLGSLQYNVWKKILDTITALPFSLDPNSAAGCLTVSEDLSSVSSGSEKVSVENPERFTSAPCVLGSRGFSEGFHAWEVDLGGLIDWRVGVSRPLKGSNWDLHDSRSGFWYIHHLHKKDECRASNALCSVVVQGNIWRVRVQLDCTEGELSFYDANRQTHIYTFRENFGRVVFPYFYMGGSQGDDNTKMLRICPLRVRVLEDIPT